MLIPPERIYFKGFNALRFYAALSVIVQHVSYSPHDWYGTPLLPVVVERFFLNGTDAVNLFFVLSGFLITYLLLSEHDRTGRVNVRNFYIRRGFRIYPVYFAFIAVIYLVLRPPYDVGLLPLLVFFLGNVAFVRFFPFPPMEHLWSISVEEQYYLLAPVLARYKQNLARILIGIILVWWTVLLIVSALPASAVGLFVQMSRYDLIALGALIAYGHYHQWRFWSVLANPLTKLLAGVVIVCAVFFAEPTMNVFYTTLVGLAFAVLIYNVAVSTSLPRILANRQLEFLGNLSYSMYVYHPLFVLLFFNIFYARLPLSVYPIVAYIVVIGVTILVSLLSYQFLEKPFLRLKDRFKRL